MNKQGWGLREMIFLSAIILFFVILASILISNLYSELVPTTSNEPIIKNTYSQIEKNLKIASERYYKKYKSEIGNVILSEELLEHEYLTQSKLQVENDTCEGYIIVDEEFAPYITCSEYETKGY